MRNIAIVPVAKPLIHTSGKTNFMRKVCADERDRGIASLPNVPPLSSGRISKPRGSQMAASEPVVLHHGREGGGPGRDEARPSVFNGLLGGGRHSRREELLARFALRSARGSR